MNKIQDLTKVEDFDICTLRKACLEGRLYVMPPAYSETENQQQVMAEILSYVSRIDACASPAYASGVRSLWSRIVQHPQLAPLLVMRQGRNQGRPNKYRITAICTILLNRGVYRTADFSAVQLHLLLEQSKRRNIYYTSMDKYWLETDHQRLLRQIIAEIADKNEK